MTCHLYPLVFSATTILLVAFAVKTSGQVKTAGDFAVANRDLHASGVAWIIISTLAGGAATIGTVEMAYQWGFAGWYFTLGSGIACLLLAVLLAPTLRQAEVVTVSEYLGRAFGARFQLFSSLFTALGMFAHVIAQFLAARAILVSVFHCSTETALGLTALALLGMVLSGGMVGASWIGRTKFLFLVLIMGLCAALAVWKSGGVFAFLADLSSSPHPIGLFSYGRQRGLLEILSVVIGVLSTQTYLQALFSARDTREAVRGALLSAFLIPLLGFLGIIVGLHLRAHHAGFASSAQALPIFIQESFPAPLAAVLMAGLFFTVLGTGSGLVLGVTTNLSVDFLEKLAWARRWGTQLLRLRVIGLLVLLAAVGIVWQGLDTSILAWSYLSMGLRGSSVLPGLLLMLLFPGKTFPFALRLALGALPVIYVTATVWMAPF